MNIKKKILISLIFISIVTGSYLYLFSNKTSLINIKSIPKTASSFIIINPLSISEDIKKFYTNEPSKIFEIIQELENDKKKFNQNEAIDFKEPFPLINFYEPFCVYTDSSINSIGLNISILNAEKTPEFLSKYYKYDTDTVINNIQLHLFDDKKIIINYTDNQVMAFRLEIFNAKSLELIAERILKLKSNNSEFENEDALELFNKKQSAFTFYYKINSNSKIKPFVNSICGNIETSGNKYLLNSSIELEKNIFEQPLNNSILKAENELIFIKSNFNQPFIKYLNHSGIFPFSFYEKYWNGYIDLSVYDLNPFLSFSAANLFKNIDFNVNLGIKKVFNKANFNKDLKLLKKEIHTNFKLKDSLKYEHLENQLIIYNREIKTKFEEKPSSSLSLRIDIQKIINNLNSKQNIIINVIKPYFKNINFESLKIESTEISNNALNLSGELTTTDKSHHVLINQFLNKSIINNINNEY